MSKAFDAIDFLTLEFIKAHYDLKTLDVETFFEKYYDVYNKLSELYIKKKKEGANKNLKNSSKEVNT